MARYFNMIDKFLASTDVDLRWTNCVAVSADGALAMVKTHPGFVALVKGENPSIMSTHCMIHRQALVVKAWSLIWKELMKDVTKNQLHQGPAANYLNKPGIV
ncbi:SCAN domain-containing protein 3 [Oopsacas minuta]|uniref:SCAN domain-containing protein 3 n=1 Tax=Oopsacas minuta TaxID=111878 RepID=A0AAV7KED9_9METZ|nr:SCAN domain-containing protein 3 [Oopsacas minuta]